MPTLKAMESISAVTRNIRKWSFRQDDTAAAKGAAIALMLAHHAFLFNERISDEFSQFSYITVGSTDLMKIIAFYGKICVAMFLFLSGFGLMKSRGGSVGERVFKSLKKFMSAYWKVLFIFVPVGFIFFSSMPHDYADLSYVAVWKDRSFSTAVLSFLGFSESYNHEWWFVSVFIITIFTMPIAERLLRKSGNFYSGLACIALIEIIFTAIIPYLASDSFPIDMSRSFIFEHIIKLLTLSTPFYMGMLMGINNNFEILHDILKKNSLDSPFASIVLLAISVFVRMPSVLGETIDPFIVPIIILAIKSLFDVLPRFFKGIFIHLGHHSTTMWLTHTFILCYYCKALQGFIMFQHWWIITWIWFIVVSFVISFIFDKTFDILFKLFHSLPFRQRNS